jgi:hypothetical protein
MSKSPKIESTNPISPSELVLLNGEQFAKKSMMGNTKLLHTDASVSNSQLGEAILTVALLAVGTNGNLKFETRAEKAMLGLRKVNSIYVQLSTINNDWPPHSPEAQLIQISNEMSQDGKTVKVNELIYSWLQQDSSSPWQTTIDMVKFGLAERDMLETSETTKMKVFTTREYHLPASTAALTRQYPIEPVYELLANCEDEQKDFCELLKKEIKNAIKRRTEQSDVDF